MSSGLRDLLEAARTLKLQLHVLNATSERDFDGVFAQLTQLRAAGLVIANETFYAMRSEQLAALAQRHAMPAVHQSREFALAGGLLSYGGDTIQGFSGPEYAVQARLPVGQPRSLGAQT